MLMRTAVLLLAPGAVIPLLYAAPVAPHPVQVRLTFATLHAAGLTTPRSAADSVDQPYLLLTRIGPGGAVETARYPEARNLVIHEDEALGPDPLLGLSLDAGDSIRLVISVLEGPVVEVPAASVEYPASDSAGLARILSPLLERGSQWQGSASLSLANDGGAAWWQDLQCLAGCRILSGPSRPAALQPGSTLAAVLEMSGAGGTYHLKLQGARVP